MISLDAKLKLYILWPKDAKSLSKEPNAHNLISTVVKLEYANFTSLFTGDIDFEVEDRLLDANLQAEVLKVAHHGSKFASSTKFLDLVNPKLAIISVGKNSYGHPHPDTLGRLSSLNIKILRTDKDGTIEVVTDGEKWYTR
ncbi:hypothetical protein HY030_02975 [Candidatus Gottesmanbacteria bacterium]|nr:hypothetical protein [Candidatus Gottesmanbacteria bacterium]